MYTINPSPAINPRTLCPGDLIGLAAPAGSFDIFKLAKGLAIYRHLGFRVVSPIKIFNQNGYLAGDDETRAAVLQSLFEDPRIRAIVCVRGGFGSIRTVEKLRWERIRKNPKPIVGFSDVTALLNAIYNKCGMVTFHGPMAASISQLHPESIFSFSKTITGQKNLCIVPKEPRTIFPGTATAPLVGGNLTTLCHMIGTPFTPDFGGHILFLEDRGEAVYRIDRMLTQFRLAGCFDAIRGVAIGMFTDCGDARQLDAVFQNTFGSMGVPVMAGFPIGHGKDNHTLPVGGLATLDTDRGGIFISSPPEDA